MTGQASSQDTPTVRPRREPEPAVAPDALPPEGEALARLLPERLSDYSPEIGASIDEVVCTVAPGDILPVCRTLKDAPDLSFRYLRLLTVVDYVEQDGELEVVYHLYSLEHHHKMVLKARVPDSRPALSSVTSVWRGADWFEREMHDLFGVEFDGHPDFRTLILPEGFEGLPGRKSYPLHDYDEW